MKRSLLSERTLVVVLFVMVIVVFSFAQADTPRIEKMYIQPGSLPTGTLDQKENEDASSKMRESTQVLPTARLR